ncbi:pepF/M3 family oligoendopeptidase [Laceyella sediminis]|uniref:PepF/M3 family oligoendopeptidase n=1 Tax=Laceyella sediminis TaxID=573074 RepID=A0ABX5ENR2_9BACL|nr:M3 family oligoendopeptidase [Laceyella sediminis]PRZ12862.1 pepF/M3 family oligoendopeptidase [Laceyella sediminis]
MQLSATYSQTWDLENIFSGGSESSTLVQHLEKLEHELPLLKKYIETLEPTASLASWVDAIQPLQKLGSGLVEARSFLDCLESQNVKDEKAKVLSGKLTQIGATYEAVITALESKVARVPESDWQQLMKSPELNQVSFSLNEMRKRSLEKLPPAQEELAGDLSVDGYHAWSEMYSTIVGRMQVPFEEGGETKLLSVGQLANKMASPDREVRQRVFEKWEEAWRNEADLCAVTINHLAGYRLQLYKRRQWENVLKEPLDLNRMEGQTLQTMWDVVAKNKHRLLPYMKRKAEMLGVDQLSWHDVQAPLPGNKQTLSYDEAAKFIIEQFEQFSPDMASFAQMAFEKRWIEAEDRPGKRPGGFMTDFPISGESRIFMTFSGTPGCVSTLAHELGHAYHTYVMKDLPFLAQQYAMNVAETASTFAEVIVIDAAIKQATSKEEKMVLLADKIQSTIAFLMDIHSRFLFETRFYEKRKQGPLTRDELCELMVEAQKEGFADMLAEYHPHFWASKLHFYATDMPFYNFPYTFGYLFSAGIYARALQEGAGFATKYVDLLRDTASMTVEELGKRHLGVDLTQPDFWQDAMDLLMADVDEFLALTEA